MTKKDLQARLDALRDRRQGVAKQAQGELAQLDDQIAACQALLDGWDTFTIEDALTALPKTGIRVRFDS